MLEILKEFFGFGGYQREPEGFMSWQHLTFVTSLMIVMTLLAIYFGKRNKNKDDKIKNRVLIWAALLIDGFEIFKIIMLSIINEDPMHFLYDLPLFLCSIQLITIPLAAFSKGRVKEAALDFVFIFGLLGAALGTYGVGNNYGSYPVLSFDNVISGITHSISGFASLYIAISGLTSMKIKNLPITFIILFFFGISAYIVNITIDYNYMFLVRGDGTPYDILYNLVNGHKVIYPIMVMVLFIIYIILFNIIYHLITHKKKENIHKLQMEYIERFSLYFPYKNRSEEEIIYILKKSLEDNIPYQ